jgi:uncharacterized protein with LGFP repeats
MRRFFGKLADAIRPTIKSRPERECRHRAALHVEALESRELLSSSPMLAVSAAPLNVPPLTPIQFKYQSLGGANGFLGSPVTGELPTPYGGGLYEQFQHGNIYWSASTGAHDVYGPILNEYFLTASEQDAHGNSVQKSLGLPATDVVGLQSMPGADAVVFQGGNIYWSAQTGAHAIYGGILTEYLATQNESDSNANEVFMAIGLPTSDEVNVPGVAGARMNNFAGGAAIYWSQATGAHVVYGAIATKYNSVGGPVTYGLPISDEAAVPMLPGVRVSNFQGGRAIYWSAATGAHTVYGAIEAEYLATAGEHDYYGRNVMALLGAPTSDQTAIIGAWEPNARMNTFQGGNIYWSPDTGAHAVYGAILAEYEFVGGPASWLGMPISDESAWYAGRLSIFVGGSIMWNPGGGATAL